MVLLPSRALMICHELSDKTRVDGSTIVLLAPLLSSPGSLSKEDSSADLVMLALKGISEIFSSVGA